MHSTSQYHKPANPLSLLLIGWLIALRPAFGQGTANDYARSAALKETLRTKLYSAPAQINWIPNTQRFWYLTRTRKGSEFVVVDAVKKTRQLAFDAQLVALND